MGGRGRGKVNLGREELVAGGVPAQEKPAWWEVQGESTWVPRGPSPLPPPQVERTEVLRSCSSPVFSRVLALEYFFEEKQPLQFHVFDAEDGATSPSNDTFLGSTECTLGQVCIPTPSHELLPSSLKFKLTESLSSRASSFQDWTSISAIHWLCSLGQDT